MVFNSNLILQDIFNHQWPPALIPNFREEPPGGNIDYLDGRLCFTKAIQGVPGTA